MSFVKYFLLSLLLPFSLSDLCNNGNFLPILVNEENSFVVGPDTEACFLYPLKINKDKISLLFPNMHSTSTTEIILYKSKTDISMKDDLYQNYYDRFLASENPFKEIDVKDFGEYIYIILRDRQNTVIYSDIVVLIDSKEPIPLKEGKPLTMKYFLSSNNYTFYYHSNKNLTFVYSSKIKNTKFIMASYNDETVVKKKVDDIDLLLHLVSHDTTEKYFYVTIEDIEAGTIEDTEFSLIIYERGEIKFNEIQKNKVYTVNYLNVNKNDAIQVFFFYYLIGNSTKSNTINFKLDPEANKTKYINIVSGSYHSEKKLEAEDFEKRINFEQNKFPIEYDVNSDQYKKIYFKDTDTSYPYRYIYFKVEISRLNTYYSPKNFLVSVGEELEDVPVEQIGLNKYKIITKLVNPYIPLYLQLLLNPKETYVLVSPYPHNTVYVDGDLILQDKNQNYIINEQYSEEDEIFAFDGTTNLTIAVYASDTLEVNIYIERYNQSDLYVLELKRSFSPINIKFTQDDCILNRKKYVLGIYDKKEYTNTNFTYSKYWTNYNGEMNVYYRNNIMLEGKNLFPYSEKYLVPKDKLFYVDNYVDFFTFVCVDPGTLTLRSPYIIFDEITHKIGQNTYNKIDLEEKTEILQLTSPIKPNTDYLYCAISSSRGNEVTITPVTPTLFNKAVIKGDTIFKLKIDLRKFKSDEMAIKINTNEKTQIEVVEVIRYNYTEYSILETNNMAHFTDNLFVKFLDKNSKKVKVTIKGLKGVPIVYGIVKLFTNDVNYLPYPTQFKDEVMKKTAVETEQFQLYNKYYGNNDKKFVAFIFGIQNYKYYEFDAQVIEGDGTEEEKGGSKAILYLVIIGSIVVVIILAILIGYFICKKKGAENKYEMDVENMDNQPLSKESRYKDIGS
jgi:hypothetical protein